MTTSNIPGVLGTTTSTGVVIAASDEIGKGVAVLPDTGAGIAIRLLSVVTVWVVAAVLVSFIASRVYMRYTTAKAAK